MSYSTRETSVHYMEAIYPIHSSPGRITAPAIHAPRALQYRAPLAFSGSDRVESRAVGASPACRMIGQIIWLQIRFVRQESK